MEEMINRAFGNLSVPGCSEAKGDRAHFGGRQWHHVQESGYKSNDADFVAFDMDYANYYSPGENMTPPEDELYSYVVRSHNEEYFMCFDVENEDVRLYMDKSPQSEILGYEINNHRFIVQGEDSVYAIPYK